ncbi:polynucleotide kinase-phosphatase [Clostridia bacterium]|nr:polynucleotide kinase-phosphatase [Clostridia bacterium]
MRIEIPELAVVAMVGASGSGKSTFAKRYFKPTEVLSSDYFRGLVSDDENNQAVTSDAFDALYYVAAKRLNLGLLTVIDATNVQRESRESIVKLAREQNCHAVAIVLNTPEEICMTRNESRPDRNDLGGHFVRRQATQLKRSLKHLEKEGFRYVFVVNSEEDANEIEIVRKPLWNNKKDEHGAFDIIGDVHGCYDELCELLVKLDYVVDKENCAAAPPTGRKAVFLGDLCDRGTQNIKTLRLVMNMRKEGNAYCVMGNHDFKLLKYLKGAKVTQTHGLESTVSEFENADEEFLEETKKFLESLISHYVFDDGKLVAAHAGLKEKLQGRGSSKVRNFCMFGETTGETDEYGLPVRFQWANEYRGRSLVVYGHTPVPHIQPLNNTVCIDTGCVFGGTLTAYRYPERDFVQVRSAKEYYAPVKPLNAPAFPDDDTLNIDDVLLKRYISTRLRRNIKIYEENSAAALEIMSRFAADPHWLIYLPPTMSPCETSHNESYLEYPMEAFNYYKTNEVTRVVCEQKHMGSRAVVVLCRDTNAAESRFCTPDGTNGIIYTRTGRRFFEDTQTETAILARLNKMLTDSGFWIDWDTDWVCLDTEIMPWSAKAQKLLEEQYSGVGRAGRSGLAFALNTISEAVQIHQDETLAELQGFYEERLDTLNLYTDAYRRYCWEVNGIDDYRVAPFHILATEGKTWNNENHTIHMDTIKKYMTGADSVFMATPYIIVDLLDENSVADGVKWWEELTESGGEGMVVKPYDFIAHKGRELLQPAVKCRGREYLRIIYGPEYTLKNNLERLKKRSLSKKRNLALNEFSLGMESLERFVQGEPLFRVHECVFGVLALESEPVDPRL